MSSGSVLGISKRNSIFLNIIHPPSLNEYFCREILVVACNLNLDEFCHILLQIPIYVPQL